MSDVTHVLSSIWYNPKNPAAFASVYKLFQQAKLQIKDLKLSQVNEWLQKQDTYTLHKTTKKRFKRNPIVAYSIDQCWFADLLDMSTLWRQNGGVRFLLVVLDVFSEFLFVEPLKNKKAQMVLDAFVKIHTETGRIYSLLATDQVRLVIFNYQ